MTSRRIYWSFLGVTYSRVGYVDELQVFGKVVYSRCGKVYRILGSEWVFE